MNKISILFVALALAVAANGCGKKENIEKSDGGSESSGPVLVLDPATVGSINGTTAHEGSPPPPIPIDMSAEPNCMKAHPTPVYSPEVVTGEKGALANVVVFIKSGLGNYKYDLPKDPVVMDQQGCMYEPHVVALRVGQTLEITNSDPTPHNVHPMPKENSEWNISQPAGASPLEETFSRAELAIPLVCNVHPWMKSYVFVFRNPYFDVTTKSGTFELKNLPPGTYTVAAWQEKYGTIERVVTIGPKESKAISFTFKTGLGAATQAKSQ
jgi:plastocyanin